MRFSSICTPNGSRGCLPQSSRSGTAITSGTTVKTSRHCSSLTASINLRACGVRVPCASCAGKYGEFRYPRALARNGIPYDSSHNTCYLGYSCDMDTGGFLLQPRVIKGIYEFPITFFRDWPGHYRHLQLCAAPFTS